jgi:hypothetical protein
MNLNSAIDNLFLSSYSRTATFKGGDYFPLNKILTAVVEENTINPTKLPDKIQDTLAIPIQMP